MAILVVLTVAVYAPVRGFDFVTYDDGLFVTDNPAVASGLSWAHVRWAFLHPYDGTGGPLTWISHMLDVDAYGLEARGHHLTNLALHLANTLLLFGVLRGVTSRTVASATVAALFAVHPLHVESVAWVAQRKDVLSTAFWLLTMWAHVAFARRPSVWRYLVVVAGHTCGLMSKPMVATLPIALFLIDLWPLDRVRSCGDRCRRVVGRLVLEKLPLLALSGVSLGATLASQGRIGAVGDLDALPLAMRLDNALVSYAAYLGKLAMPVALSPHYPYRVGLSAATVAGCAALLLALTAAALVWRRRAPAVTVGWTWYVITLAPVIGIVQVGSHAMADRHTYVPSIGIFVAVVWGVSEWAAGRRAVRTAIGVAAPVLVLVLAVAARAQVWTWQNGLTLWRHAVEVAPDNARAHANLGATLAVAQRHEEAILAYRDALRIDPDAPKVRRNLALALSRAGQANAALAEVREAIRLDPGFASAHVDLANLLAEGGDVDGAIVEYRNALRLDPRHGLARMNLAMTLARAGRLHEALGEAQQAVALEPARVDWRVSLAMLFRDVGRRDDAVRQLEAVLTATPDHADALRELRELGEGARRVPGARW